MYHEVSLDPVQPIGLGAFACTVATVAPPSVTSEERERLNAAARKVEALYPGAVGRHLRTDLESWAQNVCFRFDARGILAAAVAEILAAPTPPPVAA